MKQIKPLTSSLQILQVAGIVGHWIVLSTIDCANHEVKIYNSLYNSINEDTQTVIAALLKVNMFPHKHAHMGIQYGDTEYGRLASGDDPCNHSSVSPIDMPRCHLGECYTKHFQ